MRRNIMAAKPSAEELARQARFIFQGTVQKVKAATLKELTPTDRHAIVRVDRVIQAPEALTDFAGQEITVQLAPDEKVTAGQTFVFYTNGWIFGESLAVQSVGHVDATPAAVATLASHPDDPVRSLQTREMLTQAAAADLIVTGRVSAVRLPEQEAQTRATAMATGRTSERISEHAPLWQEAVIDVDQVHKGSHAQKQVVIRFPASTDVRWYKAPKFHTGQEGVFLLHKDQLTEAQTRGLAAPPPAGAYTALEPSDVQPLEELHRIMLAAQAPGS
jgi:hypothetical protein